MEIDIFDEIQRLRQQGEKAALATIVQIHSVPSFRTSKMLIRDDGSTRGSIGGGGVPMRHLRILSPARIPI